MKVLISGGFGYVGGRLARHLAFSGHEVFIGSRTVHSKPTWLDNGSSIVMNWEDERTLLSACKNIDVVIHAAGMNARECLKNPELALKVNGDATESLVRAASKQLVSKFIYLSSAHVYTDNLTGVITEESNITNTHPYAISQMAGEQATINGHSNSTMKTIIVRLANAIGPPLDKDVNCWMLVINDLCKQAAIDRQLVIRDSSKAVRNFITMTNVSLGLEFLINYRQNTLHPLICNMGDQTKSIGRIASLIQLIYMEEKGIDLKVIESSDNQSKTQYLDFRSSVLTDMGFECILNFKQELIELVKFCELEFGVNNEN